MEALAGPYIGLQPFTEGQRAYFFGRSREVRLVGANAFASKLTVLYGDSGVGKSSLLMAGVVPDLRRKSRTAVVLFREWQRSDAIASLKAAIALAADRAAGQALGLDATQALDDLLAAAGRAIGGTTVVLLDQFEEYFLYFPSGAAADAFDAELARAVNRRDVNAGFVLAIREDSLSRLDRLRARIPTVLANPLRIRHLREKDARDVIVQPLAVWNARPDVAAVAIEPTLVDAVIAQTRSGKVSLGRAPGDAAAAPGGDDDGTRIEAPYLQLVLTRLWDTERAAGSTTLRLATLESLGGASTIVRTHLDQVMQRLGEADQALCAAFFDRLVTPSGSKVACRIDDLRQWAGAPASGSATADVERVVDLLAGPQARILRRIDPLPGEPAQVEIFHDVLAAGVLDWRARFVEVRDRRRAQAEAERERAQAAHDLRRQRTLTRLAMAVAALGVALTALAAYFWQRTANERREADARELASRSILVGRDAPLEALRLAEQAAQTSGGAPVIRSLRLALAGNRLLARVSFPPDREIVSARLSTDGSMVALALRDDTLELRAVPSLALRHRHPLPFAAAVRELRYDVARKRVLMTQLTGRFLTAAWMDAETGLVLGDAGGMGRRPMLDAAGRGVLEVESAKPRWIDAETGVATALDACAHEPIAVATAGERILVARTADARGARRLAVCDARSGVALDDFVLAGRPAAGSPRSGELSIDGRLFALRDLFSEEVEVWDRASGKATTLRDFTSAPGGLDFGPDLGIAVSVFDGTIELWRLSALGKPPPSGPPRNELVSRLPAPIGTLLSAPTGDYVVSADAAGINLWRGRSSAPAAAALPASAVAATTAADGRVRAVLADGSVGSLRPDGRFAIEATGRADSAVVHAGPSPDRRHALVGWADGRIDWWNLADGRRVTVQHSDAPLAGLSWSSACCEFSAWSSSAATRWYRIGADSTPTSEPLAPQRGGGWLSPSRRWWLDRSGRVEAARAPASGAAAGTVARTDPPVDRTWPFVGTDRALVAGSAGYDLRIVALDGLAPDQGLIGHSQAVRTAATSPDGSQLATAGADWHVMLWNARSGSRVARLSGHTADVEQVMFSADGAFVASLGADATLRVWEPLAGATLLRVELPAAKARVLDFRGSELLLAIDADRLIRVECEPCRPPDALRALAREQLARLAEAPGPGASTPASTTR